MQIPEVHWRAKLANVPKELAYLPKLQQYVAEIDKNVGNGQGLYLFGPFGRGKSALGSILLKAAACKGYIGLWIRAKMIPTYVIEKTPFDDEMTVYDRALSVPLLVIDELQMRGNDTRFTESSAEDLLRLRIDDKKATVITSNLTVKELSAQWPSLYSVLQQAVYPVKIDGHDFRAAMNGRPVCG